MLVTVLKATQLRWSINSGPQLEILSQKFPLVFCRVMDKDSGQHLLPLWRHSRGWCREVWRAGDQSSVRAVNVWTVAEKEQDSPAFVSLNGSKWNQHWRLQGIPRPAWHGFNYPYSLFVFFFFFVSLCQWLGAGLSWETPEESDPLRTPDDLVNSFSWCMKPLCTMKLLSHAFLCCCGFRKFI